MIKLRHVSEVGSNDQPKWPCYQVSEWAKGNLAALDSCASVVNAPFLAAIWNRIGIIIRYHVPLASTGRAYPIRATTRLAQPPT